MATNSDALKGRTPHQRADLALSNLAQGGLLPPETYKEFMRIAQNATPVLKAARRVDMKSHTTKIPKIVFADRILQPDPGSGVEVPETGRTRPTTSEVALASKLFPGSVKVPYEVFDDNVEGAALEETLMTLVAEKVGIDIEEICLAGDTASADPYLRQLDGWIKRVTSQVVNAAGGDISKALFQQALTSVPLRFRQRGGFAFYTEDSAAEHWRNLIGDRVTPAGDKYTLEGDVPPCAGRPVIAVGNMPVAPGVGAAPATSSVVFTHPKNLIWGVWRDIKLRTWDAPKERSVYILVDVRIACSIEHEPAASKIINVRANGAH